MEYHIEVKHSVRVQYYGEEEEEAKMKKNIKKTKQNTSYKCNFY